MLSESQAESHAQESAGLKQGADLFPAGGEQPEALAGVPHRLVAQQRDAQLGRHLIDQSRVSVKRKGCCIQECKLSPHSMRITAHLRV